MHHVLPHNKTKLTSQDVSSDAQSQTTIIYRSGTEPFKNEASRNTLDKGGG